MDVPKVPPRTVMFVGTARAELAVQNISIQQSSSLLPFPLMVYPPNRRNDSPGLLGLVGLCRGRPPHKRKQSENPAGQF